MKSYRTKYCLFLIPLLAAICAELFLLPIHHFTFRVWESLAVKRSFGILKGQFYPNIKTRKAEEGDLAYYTPCAVKKDVLWITDTYGYRKTNRSLQQYPIVIVGDSNIAGSSLDQEELLSEVLEKKLGKAVYPLAGERLRALFQHDLIRKNLPEIVVLAGIERDIPESLPPLRPKDLRNPSRTEDVLRRLRLNSYLQTAATIADRLFKATMLNFFRARINGSGPSSRHPSSTATCPIYFLQGAEANRPSSPERIERAALQLVAYRDLLKARGIRFIFLPIPNKETVLYEYLNTQKPLFLEGLARRLRELDVEVIDAQKAFHEVYQKNRTIPYHRDDTHWNAVGVGIVAELLEKQITEKTALTYR